MPWPPRTRSSVARRSGSTTSAISTATTTRRTFPRPDWTSISSNGGGSREESHVRRNILLLIVLAVATAAPVRAGTFAPKPIAPEYGVNTFNREVSRSRVGRDLFSTPYATVTISNVDVYDRFPYVESRHFQVVSDPHWNRLVFGELGQDLQAFDGAGSSVGRLSEPRGLAVDEQDRVYVADAGNNRVLVLQATTEFDQMKLVPLYSIDGLSGPYDVAYSDGG